MKNLLRILFALTLLPASLSFGQGVIVAPQTAFKVVNGLTSPIANATITVCAANASGIPCSPALANSIFKDAALSIPLSNPFFSDSTGNYQFAIAPGNYTITVTNTGFNGQSYQMTVATPISLASGLTDPGANGVVFRNGFGTTRPAVSADVIALFSGSCSVSTFIRGDGSCAAVVAGVTSVFSRTGAVVAAANDYTFDLIGGGSNLNALSMGNGGSLQPVNFGRIVNNATWMFPTDPFPSAAGPTWTGANTGGSLVSSSSYGVVFTLVSAAGETTPSGEAAFQLSTHVPACVTSNCVITVTAPTLPIGFTGYTVYARNGTALQTLQKIAGCTNISTNCTFGSIPTTSAPPSTNALMPAPPNALTSECPPNVTPIWWLPDSNGNMHSQAYLSQYFTASGGPPSPGGTLTFCHRTWFTDQQVDPPAGKNAFIVIDHNTGVGTDQVNNQDRALWVGMSNPAGDTSTHYSITGIQSETDVQGNPVIGPAIDSEIAGLSIQVSDTMTGSGMALPNGRVHVARFDYFKSGAGNFSQAGNDYAAVEAKFIINNATFSAGNEAIAVAGYCNNQVGGTINNLRCEGFHWFPASGTMTNGNVGFYVGSGASTNTNDFLIRNDTAGLKSILNGTLGFSGIIQSAPSAAFTANASLNVQSSLTVSQSTLSGPSAVSCTGGASTYSYAFVGVDNNGGQIPTGSQNSGGTCVNPLTSGNPASVNVTNSTVQDTQFAGLVRIDVYRTAGPMGLGKIGSLTCSASAGSTGVSCSNFSDTGIVATTAVPTVNTTGGATIGGDFTLGTSKGQHINTQAANNDFAGTKTLAAGSGTVTFTRAFANAPVCVATDTTAVAAVQAATSTTTLTLTGTGTDVIAYICAGNPN